STFLESPPTPTTPSMSPLAMPRRLPFATRRSSRPRAVSSRCVWLPRTAWSSSSPSGMTTQSTCSGSTPPTPPPPAPLPLVLLAAPGPLPPEPPPTLTPTPPIPPLPTRISALVRSAPPIPAPPACSRRPPPPPARLMLPPPPPPPPANGTLFYSFFALSD
ncbi:hypothetical protein C0991_010199, partial [Blastosporella zonata]